ncbi:PAS modulated sigma54 specific transcriptional regulator, Fis family [Burkholderia sp. H160]|nr:PAS modulated sigma54 specific transcriptional regulator, Fis family [Burkholderia sp. H160]
MAQEFRRHTMSPADVQRAPILVVEDVPANLSVLLDLLSGAGFTVSVAEDGESALEQVAYAQPALILLDVMMPGLDGFATCRRLKANLATREIPVIFMTGLTDTIDKVKGLELGAVDYITKPFQHEEVLARVNTHLELQRLKLRLQKSEERLSRIIESATDAIVAFDSDGRITLFNRAAEQMFRCPANAAVGQACKAFFSPSLYDLVGDFMRGNQRRAPIWLPDGHSAVRADGESFRIEASLSSAEACDQPIYILFIRDIEERRKAEVEVGQLRGLNRYLQDELLEAEAGADLVGTAGLQGVMQHVRQVAGTDASVLVTGETGTGKELIAQALHRMSARSGKPLVKLNCAVLPANLVESELFGHEKGAFTGALARKAGRFELADEGTLFLDEVGELPLDLQAKLLRVLQNGEFERLGSIRTQKTDVRIIAATNRNLAEEAATGRFRADLYYRLNVFPIELPPLRARPEDIEQLVEHFVRHYAAKYGRHIDAVADAQLNVLRAYRWPGNVRELQHVIERAVILTQGSQLALGDWFRDATPPACEALTLEDAERAHILKVLEQTDWRVSGKAGAAERLGLPPTTLESRMKRLAITRKA